MYVCQWAGYPTLTYEVPIDGYDGRISLQTLMRRVARGCLHFVQVGLPLTLPFPFIFTYIDVIVSWYSHPPRPHHSPLRRRSHFGHLAASYDRRVNISTSLGPPKCPTSLMEKFGTRSRFLPAIIVIAPIQLQLDCSRWSPYLLPPPCLFVTAHLYHHHCTQNILPNTTIAIPFIGQYRVLLGQNISLEVSHCDFIFLRLWQVSADEGCHIFPRLLLLSKPPRFCSSTWMR